MTRLPGEPSADTAQVNFADSEFEPTDQQLLDLSREAFADVKARREEALNQLRVG